MNRVLDMEGSEKTSNHGLELAQGVAASSAWLEHRQQDPGFWVGELESNSCMEAEWLLAMHVLGVVDDPKTPGVIRAILDSQRSDGSWDVYHGAETGDINTTVECYTALRAVGEDPDSPPMVAARRWILDNDAMNQLRNFTKYWLALIGEWPWEKTPTLPPEIMFLPSWAPFNIYQFASWARSTMVPLAILCARRTCRPLPPERRLDELFPQGRDRHDYQVSRRRIRSLWDRMFFAADRVLSWYVSWPWKPGRETAVRLCLEWIIKRQEVDGAWSGIQPPWIYSLMALREEGYPLEHPTIKAGLAAFDSHWKIEREGATYLQASESPVWDTALTLVALTDCGYRFGDRSDMRRALEWLLSQQSKGPGDWSVRSRKLAGGGWAFQRANSIYPDVDDTAVVLLVLQRAREEGNAPADIDEAMRLATDWLLGMQCSNGGWAAFDRDNNKGWVTKIPFCDFGEVLDPPSVDVTAHVVEALVAVGRGSDPAVARSLDFLRREQESDGSWFGRWGVNHIYGTGAVLPALRAAGVDMNADWVRRAADWLLAHQNPDGGWGETCASYMDQSLRGKGPSTASQTGWALIGLLATATRDHEAAVQRGVDYLLAHQQDGTWDEPEYTGTGFPGYGVGARIDLGGDTENLEQTASLQRGFMLNYNLYRHYFPLMALGRAQEFLQSSRQRSSGLGQTQSPHQLNGSERSVR